MILFHPTKKKKKKTYAESNSVSTIQGLVSIEGRYGDRCILKVAERLNFATDVLKSKLAE
jgi:hypothetical protein